MPRSSRVPTLRNRVPLKVGDLAQVNVPLSKTLEMDFHLAEGENLWEVIQKGSGTCSCSYSHGCDGTVALVHKPSGLETPLKCWGFGHEGYLFIQYDPVGCRLRDTVGFKELITNAKPSLSKQYGWYDDADEEYDNQEYDEDEDDY